MTSPSHDDLAPSNSSVAYPRAFLLGIYTAAIEQGWVYITPLRQADYLSLKAQLLRLRRRADSSNKSFITADHFLCTVGPWEPGPDGQGRFAMMFSDMPEGLPQLQSREGSPISFTTPSAASPAHTPSSAQENSATILVADDLRIDEASIDSFVSQMIHAAQEKASD